MARMLLQSSSIVLVASNLVPSRFGADYLESRDIFAGLEVVTNITIEPLSQVVYSDNYLFQASQKKIKFERGITPPEDAASWNGDLVDNAVDRFVRSADFLDLTAVGFNSTIFIADSSVTPLFNQAAVSREVRFLDLALRTEIEGFDYLQLKLETGVFAETTPGIVATANFHLSLIGEDSATKRDSMLEALTERHRVQQTLVDVLNEISFGPAEPIEA